MEGGSMDEIVRIVPRNEGEAMLAKFDEKTQFLVNVLKAVKDSKGDYQELKVDSFKKLEKKCNSLANDPKIGEDMKHLALNFTRKEGEQDIVLAQYLDKIPPPKKPRKYVKKAANNTEISQENTQNMPQK